MITEKQLLLYAKNEGFHDASVIRSRDLQKLFIEIQGKAGFSVDSLKKQCHDYFREDLFAGNSDFTFLICALSCYRRDTPGADEKNSVSGSFAPFARRNYYGEAVQRLKTISKEIRKSTGMQKSEMRIFCNSKAPEKFFAWASGLGAYGNSSLIIHKTLGSNFIIAGLVLFSPLAGSPEFITPDPPGALCTGCRKCMMGCPTRAIIRPGIIDTSLCLQALSTTLLIFPEHIKRAFGNRIYGCQICQDVCPYNDNLSLETRTTRGDIGALIPLKVFLDSSPDELRDIFKKTVPGSSWIDIRSLQRNALIAAGNLKAHSLVPFIIPFTKHPHPALVDAANWALCRTQG
ncbi:MAG: hypothetical protein JXJ04_13625 [Spirochaetales bacterium]|nr:hypothetical protein [Spirochaetales bacterium]